MVYLGPLTYPDIADNKGKGGIAQPSSDWRTALHRYLTCGRRWRGRRAHSAVDTNGCRAHCCDAGAVYNTMTIFDAAPLPVSE